MAGNDLHSKFLTVREALLIMERSSSLYISAHTFLVFYSSKGSKEWLLTHKDMEYIIR